DHPMAGVGPNMIARQYPRYRTPDAVMQEPPHLHNVPIQIAAERGLPALALWSWFIIAVFAGAVRLFKRGSKDGVIRFLAAGAVAPAIPGARVIEAPRKGLVIARSGTARGNGRHPRVRRRRLPGPAPMAGARRSRFEARRNIVGRHRTEVVDLYRQTGGSMSS